MHLLVMYLHYFGIYKKYCDMECWTEIGYQLQLQSYPTSQRKKTVSQFGEKHNYHLFLMCVKSY